MGTTGMFSAEAIVPIAGRRPKFGRFILFGVVSFVAACFLFIPSLLRTTTDVFLSKKTHLETDAPEHCVDFSPLPTTAARQNVWKNFEVSEATAIRQWLWAYTDSEGNGFNFTKGMEATDFDNMIYLIETFTPPKMEVLDYFDGAKGVVPPRFAKIILHLGAASPPSISQYLLGPLPTDISSLTLSSAVLTFKPLKHIYSRPDVPYTARLWASNSTLVDKYLNGLMSPLHNATLELLGVSATPKGPRDPSAPPTQHYKGVDFVESQPEIVFGGSTPFTYDGSWRRIWMQVKKNGPGSYLKALDMYFYVDFTSSDPSEWRLLKMVYNRQVFPSTDEFMKAYRNGTLKRSSLPETSEDAPDDNLSWATRERKGTKRDLDERAGPRQVSFNGPRYRIDEDNQWVSWMGWSFYLSFARDMGLSLWDINFRGERIIYELSPQEALAVYSGSDPHQGSTVFLDGGFGMGTATRSVIAGYDCPYESLLLPATVHAFMGSSVRQNAICVFERDSGRPLSRHTGYLKGEMGAIKGYELVVRTISTVGNYDYLFDYTFQLDGTMEVRISASGYMQGAWWDSEENDYGTRIRSTYMGSLHDHVINYKVDFDIAGIRNSLMAISLENEVVHQPWFDDEDWGTEVHQQKIVRKMVRNESEALLDFPKNYEGLYVLVNEETLNRWGYPRGYAIHPGVSAIHMTNLDSKRTKSNVNFAKHHLGVSRRKDTEPSSSTMWNINLPGAPPVDFYDFFDGESLEQEDLVVWLNLGMHHIPRAEDSPMTLTNIATSSVLLAPFNFNDWDPAMESMNAVLMNVPEPGETWTGDENGVRAEYCLPPRLRGFSYSGLTTFEEDGTPGMPERIWDMRKQAESYHAIFAAAEL